MNLARRNESNLQDCCVWQVALPHDGTVENDEMLYVWRGAAAAAGLPSRSVASAPRPIQSCGARLSLYDQVVVHLGYGDSLARYAGLQRVRDILGIV